MAFFFLLDSISYVGRVSDLVSVCVCVSVYLSVCLFDCLCVTEVIPVRWETSVISVPIKPKFSSIDNPSSNLIEPLWAYELCVPRLPLCHRGDEETELKPSWETEDTHISILLKIHYDSFHDKIQERNNEQKQTYRQGKQFMCSTKESNRVELNRIKW